MARRAREAKWGVGYGGCGVWGMGCRHPTPHTPHPTPHRPLPSSPLPRNVEYNAAHVPQPRLQAAPPLQGRMALLAPLPAHHRGHYCLRAVGRARDRRLVALHLHQRPNAHRDPRGRQLSGRRPVCAADRRLRRFARSAGARDGARPHQRRRLHRTLPPAPYLPGCAQGAGGGAARRGACSR